jgi:hypothetical protein
MVNFAYYAVATIWSPVRTMKRLQAEPRPIRAAAEAVGFVGLLYALTSIVLALVGAVPLAPALVSLNPGNYYFWQTFFVIPCLLLAWVLVAGLTHILAKHERSRPAYEMTASLAGTAMAGALFAAWVPMGLEALFLALGMSQRELAEILSEPGGWQLLYIVLYIAAAGVAVVLLSVAAGHGHLKKCGRGRAVMVGSLGAVVLAGIFALFVR